MKAVFFSDAHLAEHEAERAAQIETFLRRVTEDADVVVALGDIFEFYHGYDGYIYPFYKNIVNTLRDVAKARSVYFIEGNHEFGMGRFFEAYTGVTCARTLTLNIDGQRVFLCHGDAIKRLPVGLLLKSRPIYTAMDLLGPVRTWRVAMQFRRVLAKKHKLYNPKVAARFRRYGEEKLREGYDAVIVAHSHMPELKRYEVDGKERTYMNTGDLVASRTYGAYTSGRGFTIETYDRRVS